MRRFDFRFQRVFELKERLEEVRKAALGEAVGAFEAERLQLEGLQVDRQRQVEAERPAAGRVDPALMNLLADYCHRLEHEADRQGEQVRLADALVAEKRGELLAATRERRTFEILRERALAAHRKQVRRHELAALDEIGGQLHLRRQRADAATVTQDDKRASGWPDDSGDGGGDPRWR